MVSGGTSNEVLPWYGSYLLEGGKRRRDQSKFEVGQRERERDMWLKEQVVCLVRK